MKSAIVLGIALALFILLVFSSVYTGGAFGVNDDYQYLQRVYAGTFDPANNEQTGMGRQAAAWMLNAAYALCAGSVANLVYLRLAALAGIILFTGVLYVVFRRIGQDQTAAATAALCVACSPACGVYAAWGAAFLCPYALTICLLAGLLLQDLPASRRARLVRCGGAMLLILLACGMWQAAAPMALFAGFGDAWRRVRPGSPPTGGIQARGIVSAWLIVGSGVAAYLVAQRIGVRLGWVHGTGLARMAVTMDWRSKTLLLGGLLRSGFTSWARFHSLGWELPVTGLTLLACGNAILGTGAAEGRAIQIIRRAALAVGMILASISPLLAASENNASFRALPALYTIVAFLAVEGAILWLRHVPAWTRAAACFSLATLLGICAAYHVRAGIVVPNAREYGAVSKLVRRQFREMPPRLVYLAPFPVLLAPTTMKPSWEYGLASSSFWWVTKPFLLDIFRAQKMCRDPKTANLEIFYREVDHPDLPVLNPMPEMLREPGEWREDARWGRVLAFSQGWIYSPWFGYLNVREFPIIQHHTMGALLYIGGKPDEFWLHKEGLGNFYASKVSFPYLFVNERNGWVFLLDTDRSHCAVRDAAGQRQALTQ